MHNGEKILFLTPAAPGFYVLNPCLDEAGAVCEASREPVVAWAVDALGSTIPVTPHEVLSGDDDHAILCPDGEVRSYDGAWESVADWLEEQKAKVQHDKLR
ncbi:MAG: hypothetical protein RKP46_12480 [Candidatus Accumulibacter sp.]|uniref:hypothetical protein n=1 Tax=Accumulibacter sp. TaxID=2053492 RepID=UPI00287A496F|nr:hypothetical protein [Accumulibacter sp.]MDS4015145.1 hypothetical protein [Accumulibacter sp.]